MNNLKTKKPEEIFVATDLSTEHTYRKEFENCEFKNCSYEDLSEYVFRDCKFINCNLSNLKTKQTIFQSCLFVDCKLMGINFSTAKDFAFEVYFENCNLDYTSFDKKKMNKSSFTNCKIHSGNFTQTDLSKSNLTQCDLFETLFSGTNLNGVDLTTCHNFIIDPELNKIKKAKFNLQSLPGLLQRYEIIIENS